MIHITRAIAARVLNELPVSFDTHRIERRILRLYTVEFAEELLEYRKDDDPLLRFSAAFSQWIGKTFNKHIAKSANGKVKTENLGGEISENQEWTKLSPGVPIA